MKSSRKISATALCFLAAFLSAVTYAPVAALPTKAKQALVVDYSTGRTLLARNADAPMHPASMTKMMTAFMVFDRLRSGTLSLDTKFRVSKRAWKKGGSRMFLKPNDAVSVEDLIRGIIVQSGNDASIVIAEGISGSEEDFAREMTEKAREIGMKNSTFKNASGWPDEEHLTTARDLATLINTTIREFPDFYHYYAEAEFKYANINQRNRNPLLGLGIGADGLKTGHTEVAGYGLAASAIRKNRRIIVVVNGLESKRDRARESRYLLNWAYRTFDTYRLFVAGETVADASVWLGAASSVPLILERDLFVTLKKRSRKQLRVVAKYTEPIVSPIRRGDRLGVLVVNAPGENMVQLPLIAGASVAELGRMGRLSALINHLLWGKSQ